MKSLIALIAIAGLAPAAMAQDLSKSHPADPSAKVPDLKYESAFSGYSPYREEKLVPWRDVNDEVGRIGGHVGMFGGGHGGHAGAKPGPAKPAAGQPAGAKPAQPAGQAPARSEPKAAVSGGHTGH